MSYNGSGTFNINTTGQPVVAGTVISSSAFNALTTDLATGLTTAITKDGQTTTTARITFAQGITSSLTTDSSSVSTGSIITGGGVGIAKALYVGTTANVAGAVTLGGIATFSAQPIFSSLTASSAVATDASKGLVSVTNTGTGNNVLATSPTITTPTISGDASISGLTVGKGGGAVSTNTAVGASALNATNTGGKCTAFGYQALKLTTGKENTAFGSDAGAAMTSGEGLAAFGWSAAKLNTGDNNTAIGHNSLGSNTTAANNTAIGNAALNANTTGAGNVAVGRQALVANTTASDSTAVGYQAGYTNSTGLYNTFVGAQAGYSSTGGENTCVGRTAGYSISTGTGNTFIGPGNGATSSGAGYFVTTGSDNTIIGGYNGNQGGLDIRTSSSNIVLSDGDGNPRGYFNTDVGGWRFNNGGTANSVVAELLNASASQPYGVALNFSAATPNNTTNYFFYCYDSTNVKAIIYSNGSFQGRANSYGGISDIKLKQDIIDATSQWNDVKAFQIKKYRFKDEPDSPLQLGVIAQELEQTSPNLVYESPDFITNEAGEREELGTTTKAVKYSILYMKAVKALQEAMTRIEQLETDVAALKGN